MLVTAIAMAIVWFITCSRWSHHILGMDQDRHH